MFEISHDLKTVFKNMTTSKDRISLFPGSSRLAPGNTNKTKYSSILSFNKHCQAPTVCQKCPNIPRGWK